MTAQLWFEKYDYPSREYVVKKGPTFKTDDKGFLNISNSNISERQFFVEFINGNDVYYNNNSYYTYKQNTQEYKTIQSTIFTDRAIYRPGQIIYFKFCTISRLNSY